MFDVRVEVVEPLGEEVLVHGSVDAPAVVGTGELERVTLLSEAVDDGRAAIVLRLPPEERPSAGSRLRVAVAPHAVRLFDATSGVAIPPA